MAVFKISALIKENYQRLSNNITTKEKPSTFRVCRSENGKEY